MKLTNVQTIIGVALLVLIAGFYWYEYRPTKVRSACYKEAIEKVEAKDNLSITNAKAIYELRYRMCINKNGL